MAKLRLGALEAGGTKMVCAIGDENGTIYEQDRCIGNCLFRAH